MNKIMEEYGNKLRIRVCGICIENESLLLINHTELGEMGDLWIPPGGGMEFGESAEEALKREFREETNLEIEVGKLLAVNEYFNGYLHAIELFFQVNRIGGDVVKGIDPEFLDEDQIIKQTRFVTFTELNELPNQKKHNLLQGDLSSSDLLNMNGYFKLWQ